MCNEIDGFPLFSVEENTAGKLRTLPTDHGQVKNPPGDQHVEHDGRLKTLNAFELKFFDLAAGFEDSEEDLDLPAAQIPAQGFLCFFPRSDESVAEEQSFDRVFALGWIHFTSQKGGHFDGFSPWMRCGRLDAQAGCPEGLPNRPAFS